MKRLLWFVAAGVLALSLTIVIGVVVVVHELGRKKAGALQQWVGQQIASICNDYLKPRLTFSQLQYEFPGTVYLRNLRLTADDPANKGTSIDILQVNAATVQLAGIPIIGQPIQIKEVVLDQPVLRAVAMPGESDRFVGFSDLLKSQASTSNSAPVKLSDYFQMRQVELNDGRVIYDPRAAGQPPMELDHVQTQLHIVPAGAGWYAMATSFKRPPGVDVRVAGQLSLDTFVVRKLDLQLDAQLKPGQIQYLPPQIQQLLREHDVQGALALSVTGTVPILDYKKGNLAAQMTLRDAKMRMNDYNLAVDWMRLKAHLDDGKVNIDSMNLSALDGQADLRGTLSLDPLMDTQVKLTVARMRLDDLFTPPPGEAPPIAGRIHLQLRAAAPLKSILANLSARAPSDAWPPPPPPPALPPQWGEGFIQLNHGRLVDLPVIRELAQQIGHANGIDNNDQGLVHFTLSGNQVLCQQVAVVGSWFAVRGVGELGLNQVLNFKFNGGPLEKMESLMGKDVGAAMGQITDALASYHVSGTVERPQIVMRAGSHALGNTVQQAGNDIQQGIDDLGEKFQGIFGR